MKKRLYFWGIADIGEGFIGIVSGTYLAIFLSDVALLPIQIVSAILLITSITDVVISPLGGAYLASTKALKWGRLRSWLLIGPPITILFYILHFTTVPNNNYLTAFIVTIGFIAARSIYTLTYTSNLALINVLASDIETRSKLAAQRMVGSNAGRLMGNYLTPIIVAFLLKSVSERYTYMVLIAIAGIVYITTCLIHFYISSGYEGHNNLSKKSEVEKELTIREMVKCLSTNMYLLLTVLIDLTSNVAALALPSLAVYYYKYVLQNYSLVPIHMLCIGLAGLVGALSARFTSKFVKHKRNYLCGAYILVAIFLVCTRFASHSPYGFIALNILVHMITGSTQPYEFGLYADNVIYTKWKTGENANSLIMGMGNLPVKFASIIKSVLISGILLSVGYVANVKPTVELQQALINGYSLIPACIPIIGFILLRFVYKLTDERVAEMKLEIEKRENI